MTPSLRLLLALPLMLAPGLSGSALAQDGGQQQDQGYAPSTSELHFGKDAVNLGDVYQENEYMVEFPFSVQGPDPVLVTAIETSCGCTEAYFEIDGKKIVLDPGKPIPIPASVTGVIKGRFSTQQFHNAKVSTITIRGNGKNLPAKLTISAMIHPVFELSPSRLAFGEVLYKKKGTPLSDDEKAARTKEVLVKAPEAFTVTRWAYTPEGVVVEDTGKAETGPDGKSQTRSFRITIAPDAPAGRITSSILGETSLGKTLEIVMVGEILGPVKYYPGERILFGMVNQGQAPTRRLTAVVGGPGMTLPEPKIEVEGDAVFSAEIVEKQDGQQYVVKIDLKADAAVGRHSAVLRLTFPGDSGIEPKEVPISAVVRQPQ